MKHYTSTLAPDILPHCPFVFLRSNVCLPPFRAGSLRRRPGGSATVGVTSPRREPFIPPDQTPAGHTSAGFRACGLTELSSSVGLFAPLNWGLEVPRTRRQECLRHGAKQVLRPKAFVIAG